MPGYVRGRTRDIPTFVLLYNAPINIYYFWSSKDLASLETISASDLSTQLGHLTSVADSSVVVVGATSPKPPSVKKIIKKNPGPNEQGSATTFCSPGSLNSAYAAGWKRAGYAKQSGVTNNARTITGLAGISNGMIYGWPFNASDHATYKEELALIEPSSISTAERNTIVTGATRPVAGHATKKLSSGATVSGYFSPDAPILENGWNIDRPEIT